MREFDLVGILDGMHTVAPLPELQMVPHDGLTAVLTALSRPAMRLPKSRKQVLMDTAVRLRWQEACMPLGTILSARPDSTLTRDGADAFLTANRQQLARVMQRFGGLVQVQARLVADVGGQIGGAAAFLEMRRNSEVPLPAVGADIGFVGDERARILRQPQ